MSDAPAIRYEPLVFTRRSSEEAITCAVSPSVACSRRRSPRSIAKTLNAVIAVISRKMITGTARG